MADLAPVIELTKEPSLVRCPHPLLAGQGRELFYSPIIEGETLRQFLRRLGEKFPSQDWLVYVNDRLIEDAEREDYRLHEGDLVILRARLQGGGDSGDKNKTFRTIATIAVLLIAQQYDGATRLAIAALGSYAAARLFPPVFPPNTLKGELGSPTYSYSIDGGNNRIRPFEPLPAVLGTHRVFADLGAKSYTEFVGEDQFLYQVFNFGVTDIALSSFKIGDTPVSSFNDYEIEESDSSGALTLFPTNVDAQAGSGLTYALGWVTRTSSADSTGLAVELSGFLFYAGTDGYSSRQVIIGIEYREVGSGTWLNFVSGGQVLLTHSSREPLRWGYRISVPSGQYEVRVQRVSADETDSRATSDITWTQLKSYQPDTADYTGQKRVALKIRANEQLQGQVDTFNALASVSCDTWNGSAWVSAATSNPAYLFLYWARGKFNGTRRVFGVGLADSQIDLEAIKDWGVYCDAKSLTCNLVFDRTMTVDQQLAIIARCGRGAPTRAGGVLGVLWDAGGQPVVAHFGLHNIRAGSFKVEYKSRTDVDEVVVNFINPDIGYKPDSVRVPVPGVIDPVNALTIDLMGCTDKDMAGAEANLEAASFAWRKRRILWETDLEGMVVRRGDVVVLTHDLTQWDHCGRILSGGNSIFTVDRPPIQFYITIRSPRGAFATYQVSSIYGNQFTLLKPFLKDIYDGSSVHYYPAGYQLRSGTGYLYEALNTGHTAIGTPAWPDVLGETVVDNEITWVCLSRSMDFTPDDDPDYPASEYLFFTGPLPTPGKKVKIIDFIPKNERHIQLVATDEEDDYYLSESDPFLHAPITASGTTPLISNVQISDTLIRVGSGYAVRITITWEMTNVGTYGGAIIRAAPSGEALKVVDRTFSRRTDFNWSYSGSIDFEIILINLSGEYSDGSKHTGTYTIKGKDLPPSDVTNFTAALDGYRILLSWLAVPDADVASYEIREGVTWDTGSTIAEVTGTRYTLDIAASGSHDYLIKARDTSGNLSVNAASTSITIGLPSVPSISHSFDKGNVILSWSAVAGDFPIVEYEIRYGTDWASGVFISTIKASAITLRANWSGVRTFWVAGIDAAGNVGTASGVGVTVMAPGAPVMSRKVIDNYVLLSWVAMPGTLPIDHHEIRRGDVFASAEVVGDSTGSFTTIFESAAGTYTYWAVPFDVAGNQGTEASVVALVNAPPDFVLREDWLSDYSGTKTNAFVTQLGELLVNVDTTETWADHFVNNSWATPQDQVDAGYSYYAMPSQTTGSYEETFDYGAVLEGTLISVVKNVLAIAGSVGVSTTISTRKLITDAWTDNVGVEQVYATDFRYVKVKLDFTSSGGDDLLLIKQLHVQLSVKELTDAGNGTANAADSGGTTVNFNKAFIAVESITVTPKGTTPIIAVYDFAGTPYPTSFSVYLFDDTLTRVSGDFSWKARGN